MEGCKSRGRPRLTFRDQIDRGLSVGRAKFLKPASSYEKSNEETNNRHVEHSIILGYL